MVVLLLVLRAAAAHAAPAFPVSYSADQRYLVDQNGVPFPILGRTAWFVTSLSVANYRTFLDDTAARGYTAIEFHVINHDPRGNNPPFNGNGDAPFLKRLDGSDWNGGFGGSAPDFTTPNEAYWTFVDGLLAYCESKGLLVFMFPAYGGYLGGDQGWMQEMLANGQTNMETYGAWIATRYQSQKNLVWMMGGDMGTPPNTFNTAQTNVESGLLTGLTSVAGQQSTLFSAEWNSDSIGTDQTTFGTSMTLNSVYSFSGDVNTHGRRAYAHAPVEPAFLLEEPYDEEGPDGNGVNGSATQPVRRFQWWGWLSTIGGYISGNGYVWPFNAPAWQNHLDTQGSRDMARLNAFIGSLPWHTLVPSGLNGMRTLVTAGGSSVSADDYVAAAAVPDGTLLVAYVPPDHAGFITVDMGAMGGSTRARWFDPTSAAYTPIATDLANSGSHDFTPPGSNAAGDADWVLVLDVPGGVPDTTPPARFNGLPSGTLAAGTTQTTLSLITNENATCRWAIAANVPYGSMPNTFDTTGGTGHSTLVTGLVSGGSYSRYVRCQDAAGNANTTDFTISFSVALSAFLQFSVANFSVSEASPTATITVKRSGATSTSVQVHYETSDGTAVADTDYTHTGGDLVFPSGQTSKTFTVGIIPNTVVDGPRTVLLQLSNPQNAQLGPQQTAALTIQDDDGGGTFKFSATGYTYPDKAGYATITVQRSGGTASGASVQVRTGAGGTATPGSDFVPILPAPPTRLTFAAGELSQTFQVHIVGNTLATDATKTVELLLDAPGGGATVGPPATATLSLTNDDAGGGLRFSASSYAVPETAGSATLTVTRSGGVASGVTVQLVALDGTAKAGFDYGPPTPSLLTFAALETSKIVDVPLMANPLAAANRTLTVTLQTPTGGATLSAPSTTTVTLTKVGIRFSQPVYTVNEGLGPVTIPITVVRNGTTAGTSVLYATEDGSAGAPADYERILPTALNFPSGKTSVTFPVTIQPNPGRTSNRQLQLHLTGDGGEVPGVPADATLIILSRQAPQLQLSSFSAPLVAIRGKPLAVANTVRNFSAAAAGASTLQFVLSGDATFGNGDDTPLGTRAVPALAAGGSSAATTSLTISAPPGAYTLFALVDAAGAVPEQDDSQALHLGQVLLPLTVVSNLVKTFPVSGDLTQTSCVSPLRNGRLAVQGTLIVSMQAGTSLTGALSVTFPLVPGLKLAGPVTATVDGTGALTGTVKYTTTQGSTTISTGTATLASTGPVNESAVEVQLTGTPLTGETCDFMATLASPADPIAFVTFHHDAQAGSLGVDNGAFTALSVLPVTIGQHRLLFEVAVDTAFPPPGTVLFTDVTHATLTDQPADEFGQLATNAGQYRSRFVAGTAAAGDWTVSYKGQDVDAALPDPDAASRLVVPIPTFAPANTLQQVSWFYADPATGAPVSALPSFLRSIRLQVLDPCGVALHDSQALAPTTTSRTLSPAVALASVAEVRFLYVDDRENTYTVHYGTATPGACRVVEFGAPSYSIAENVSPAGITVRRVGDTSGTVHVHFATSPGTAAPADFVDADTDLTFLPGVTTLVVPVPIVNNSALNPSPRTVLLALSGPDGGATVGPLGTAVLTINDDEPRIRFSSTTYSVAESKATATITVQRTGATAPVVSVHYATSDGTALAGADYQDTSGVLSFASGQTSKTFTVPVVNDLLAEGGETVNLTLSDPLGALLTAPATAVLTIADNDPGGTVAFSAAVSSVAAGGLATITVTRTGGTGGGVTVHYATSDPGGPAGAVAGSDYDAVSDILTFGPKETTKTFDVQTHAVLANKAVTLSLSPPSVGAALGSLSSATLWIVAAE